MLDPGEIGVGEAEGGEIADVVDHGRLGGRRPVGAEQDVVSAGDLEGRQQRVAAAGRAVS
jgi:hypothetical protein